MPAKAPVAFQTLFKFHFDISKHLSGKLKRVPPNILQISVIPDGMFSAPCIAAMRHQLK